MFIGRDQLNRWIVTHCPNVLESWAGCLLGCLLLFCGAVVAALVAWMPEHGGDTQLRPIAGDGSGSLDARPPAPPGYATSAADAQGARGMHRKILGIAVSAALGGGKFGA